jgi:hypothetical protein
LPEALSAYQRPPKAFTPTYPVEPGLSPM